MNILGLLASQAWVERLGWTLLHFLWQGAAVAILYAMARTRLRSSQTRYVLGCAALALMMAAPVATWKWQAPAEPAAETAPNRTATIPSFRSIPATPAAPLPAPVRAAVPARQSTRFLPWVVAMWMIGSLVFWIRLLGGWAAAAGARARTCRPAPAEWQRRLEALRERVRVSSRVRLMVSAWAEAPLVTGWLRPVVLMPIGALNGMPAEYVEALLMHELAHVRRGDFLVNLLQSVAEALLFYHPAVWWVSGHIRTEREACCDGIAARESGDVLMYASALAELESQRSGLRMAMAANGGSLADRVARLLGEARPPEGGGLVPGVVTGMVLLVSAYGLFGQAQLRPAFQAASIKPYVQQGEPFNRSLRPMPGGRLTAHNAPVVMLVQNAYRLQAYQIVGGPDWTNSDGYDIEAKPDHEAGTAEVWQMLQTLLADRFKLAVHRETRELPVWVLEPAKGGSRLPAPKDPNCSQDGESGRSASNLGPCGRIMISMNPGALQMLGRSVKMPAFIEMLAAALGRPVLDRTDFKGAADIDLKFTPDELTTGLPGGGGPRDPGGAPQLTDPGKPNIAAALEEQLGLKLEKTKGPVEVVVIDHVERPTAN